MGYKETKKKKEEENIQNTGKYPYFKSLLDFQTLQCLWGWHMPSRLVFAPGADSSTNRGNIVFITLWKQPQRPILVAIYNCGVMWNSQAQSEIIRLGTFVNGPEDIQKSGERQEDEECLLAECYIN